MRQTGPMSIQPQPGLVYHYTSLFVMKEVLSKAQMWATDIGYMNDTTELKYGRDEFASRIRDLRENFGDVYERKQERLEQQLATDEVVLYSENDLVEWTTLLSNFESNIRDSTGGIQFALCFCKKPDLLSQWRSYGAGGCALGVETDNIVDKSVESVYESSAREVEYGVDRVDEVFRRYRDFLCDPDRRSSEVQERHGGLPVWGELQGDLAFIKHPDFREEEETRIVFGTNPVFMSVPPTSSGISYKVSGSGLLTPYIVVRIKLAAVKHIVIAPSRHQRENHSATYGLCSTLGLDHIEVESSSTPFRGDA